MSKRPRLPEDARRGAFTANEIAALLREKYEKGRRLIEQSTDASANQPKPDLTVVSGPSSASRRVYQNEYRRFAAAYTPEELEELLKLRTKKEGTPLGWGIVRKLMAVPDKTSAGTWSYERRTKAGLSDKPMLFSATRSSRRSGRREDAQ